MRHLLFVRGSIFGDEGQSSKLADAFLRRFTAAHPDTTVVVRDVQQPRCRTSMRPRFKRF